MLNDVPEVLKGQEAEIERLKDENELIKRNNEELEKQRTEFAMKIEKLTRENKRLKEKFDNFGKELFYD